MAFDMREAIMDDIFGHTKRKEPICDQRIYNYL
jgi:hypothetical protein